MWSVHSHLNRQRLQVAKGRSLSTLPSDCDSEGYWDDDNGGNTFGCTVAKAVTMPSGIQICSNLSSPRMSLRVQDEEEFLQQLLDDEDESDGRQFSLGAPSHIRPKYHHVQHVILPEEDTFDGICLRYGITPTQLRQANGGFSGTNLRLAPATLNIPLSPRHVDRDENSNHNGSFEDTNHSNSDVLTRQVPSRMKLQDTNSNSYKIQVLINQFPCLDAAQAQAYVNVMLQTIFIVSIAHVGRSASQPTTMCFAISCTLTLFFFPSFFPRYIFL